MARLTEEPYPLPEYDPDEYDDYREHMEEEQAALNDLLEDDSESVVKFPRADGYAMYRVVEKEPLLLQHIPYGDAYRIPAAHIRGLRWEDIEGRVNSRFW